MSKPATTIHATAVVINGKGLLITGAPGTGKSSLALDLIARGGMLLADDQVGVSVTPEGVVLRPVGAHGLIEARGIGILAVDHCEAAPLSLWVDLDEASPERLPHLSYRDLLGNRVPVILAQGQRELGAILWVLITRGRLVDPDTPVT